MRGGWEVAEAVKAAPWVLAAVGFGLFLSVSGMLAGSKHYEHSTQKQRQRSDRDREPERCPAGCMTWV